MATGLPAGVKEVQRVAAPGGGYYVLGSDGGVFALSDDQGKTPAFYGSVPGIKGDTFAGQHQFGAGALSLDPTGGYTVRDTAGRTYGFNTDYARGQGYQVPDAANTIMSDPAMMAFLRTSGLGIDQAAANVQMQTANLREQQNLRQGEINMDYDKQQRSTRGNYESRGILRSSDRQQAEDSGEQMRGRALESNRQATGDQIAGLNRGLTQQVLGVQQQAAEKSLGIADNQAIDAWGNEMRKKYPDAFSQQLAK